MFNTICKTRPVQLLLLVALVSYGFPCWSQKRKPKKILEMPAKVFNKVAPVTVQIVCNRGEKTGTGSIVANTAKGFVLVLTACHVVATNFDDSDPDLSLAFYKDIRVRIATELRPVRAFVIPRFVDRANDLALLVTASRVSEQRVITYTRSDRVKPGAKVAAVGFPNVAEPTLTVGSLTQIENQYLVYDAKIAPGSSGGPLIDKKGRMIGLATHRFQGGDESQGYALNMNLILSMVEGWLNKIKLKKRWQFDKDGSFFTSPLFISGLIISTGAGIVGGIVLPGGGVQELSGPPDLPPPPDVN